MFDIAEQSAFIHGHFKIYSLEDDHIVLRSRTTKQMWLIKKFDDENYPPMVLYHSHNITEPYHVHCVYDNDNALLCYIEITNHDKLITQRMKLRKKLTRLTNQQLVEAVMA